MSIESSQKAAVAKYVKTHYDRIDLRVEKGFRDEIKAAASASGESVNAFINRCIRDKIAQDTAQA